MANIFPFQPYRYASGAGPLQNLVTQPYDKISPAMQRRYLEASPYNLVRVILGERNPDDNETENVYTRATRTMQEWIASGVWARDAEPGMFAYFQEFVVPDTGERLVRKGFIALGQVEEYSAGIVFRHEQTLSGPKKDRMELLQAHPHPLRTASSCCTPTRRAPSTSCSIRPPPRRPSPKSPTSTAPSTASGRSAPASTSSN